MPEGFTLKRRREAPILAPEHVYVVLSCPKCWTEHEVCLADLMQIASESGPDAMEATPCGYLSLKVRERR